jgi:serine/threonine protein kinase
MVRLGRYRLVERRAIGGMAEVWRAEADGPRGFHQTVVIKRLHRKFGDDPEFVTMLAREARLASRLRHPSIVQVHELGESGGEHFLAMEFVDGWDLHEVQRACARVGQRLPLPVVCHVMVELADALSYAHAMTDEVGRLLEIVHRDLTPSNVMLTKLGQVKLLDFGVARARDEMTGEHTVSGLVKGTPAYMSPEQADGAVVDHRSDLFSLGVLFHELLTGARLFKGDTDLDSLRRVRTAPVPSPSAIARDVPTEVERVVLRLLARRPDERYQSGREVLEDLRPVARRLGGDAEAVRTLLTDLRLRPATTEPPASPPPSTRPMTTYGSRHRTWLIAAAITAAVIFPFALPSC